MNRFRDIVAGAVLAVALGSAVPASADTLREALLRAYRSNPTITAARADLRATDETVPLAKAQGKPQVNGNAEYDEYAIQPGNTYTQPQRQVTAGATLSVPIYQGGLVRNSVRAAKTRVLAGRADLRGTESDLFTNVVGAYMDVIRDEAIVRLNRQNVHVLDVNLQATTDRFQVGDLTRTDVAQSKARLAQARGQLRDAEAQLISSRESYINLVGVAPEDLQSPPDLPNLPGALDGAVEIALRENPQLIAARRERDARGFDVDAARADRKPTLSAFVGGNYYNYLDSTGVAGANVENHGTSATAGLRLSVPIYQGGGPAASVRQAQAREGVAIEQVTGTQRGVIANTRSAYAAWQAAQDRIDTSQVAVRANRLSLEGVRAENSVGTRTILDILNAEQELLNTQVDLVTAQRNAYVAGFALLAAMGRAEADDLQLDAGGMYDPTAHYDRVKNKWWDWDDDPEPVPVATGTDDTPAQTAVVKGAFGDDLAVDPETGEQKEPKPSEGE